MTSLRSFIPVPFSINDFSQSDIYKLTRILSFPPNTNNNRSSLLYQQAHAASKALINELPSHLRAPVPFQHKIVKAFSKVISLPGTGAKPLCSTHNPMNAQLIHTIFATLALEVGKRLNNVVSYGKLSSEQQAMIHNLRCLHSMWLDTFTYEKTFLESPTSKWAYQEDGCEACILSRVGGDTDVLLALDVAIRSRVRKSGRRPRLFKWVKGWIYFTEDPNFQRSLKEKKSAELRKARRSAHRAARRAYDNMQEQRPDDERTSSFDEDEAEEAEDSDDDCENDIIDHYAALTSTTYLPQSNGEDRPWQFSIVRSPGMEGYVHPTFRNNVDETHFTIFNGKPSKTTEAQAESYQNLIGRAAQSDLSLYVGVRTTRWSAPGFRDDEGEAPAPKLKTPPPKDQKEEEQQNLLGRPTGRRRTSTNSTMTKWGAFYKR
ncbi:MAG: hypothetical protein M1827_001124 [Pycnora praestabilis]|nr:MAG: hypothetical protein M1827_001124 [Pycnora praestabilis]